MRHFAVLLLLLLVSQVAQAQDWCASSRLNLSERTICASNALRALDVELNRVHDEALSLGETYGQNYWLRQVRDVCGADTDCLDSRYRLRIQALRERIQEASSVAARPWCRSSRLNPTELTICATGPLRDLDAQLQVAYGQARAKYTDTAQLTWLRQERDACGRDTTCIARAYTSRIRALRAKSSPKPNVSVRPSQRQSTSVAPKCSTQRINQLKATCVIATVGERACASQLRKYTENTAIQSGGASAICASASMALIDGEIDPSQLGLSIASGFLDGAGDSLLESEDAFDIFTGVIFKLGSAYMDYESAKVCMRRVDTLCN